jgi:hypothetical protein
MIVHSQGTLAFSMPGCRTHRVAPDAGDMLWPEKMECKELINHSAAWIGIDPEQTTKRLMHELKAEEFNVVVFHQQRCFRILFDLGTQHAVPGFKELFIFFVTIH